VSKPLIATVITVKATLFAASVAFARGDMPSVILVSALFRLVQLGTKSVGQALPRDPIVVSRSDDRSH
jgi:mannose/fructose/N-acetylgalactosamine-specific phosphotransferase system component IIC